MTTLPGVLPFDNGDNSVASHAAWLRGLQAAVFNPLPFTKSYESAQQVITSGGPLTLAHGLGVQPKLVQTWLHCVIAEHGYSAGDEVLVAGFATDASSNRGASVVPDATNITVRYGNIAGMFLILDKTLGTIQGATNGNWRLIVRAWA